MQDFYHNSKFKDAEEERLSILTTAAKHLKSEIRSINVSKDVYPSASLISSLSENLNYIPKGLRTFLQGLLAEKENHIKVSSIGQALMQATRPRCLLSHLQIGLAIQMHHTFGSRSLIDTLYNMGFCSSYSEVQRFEKCAAFAQGISLPGCQEESFVQCIADNVDHNICTLDGNETFHRMGIVAGITPGGFADNAVIKRYHVTIDDLKSVGKIGLTYYKAPIIHVSTSELKFIRLEDFSVNDHTYILDIFLQIAWPLKTPTPGWSGV